jgi:hypothetical protein
MRRKLWKNRLVGAGVVILGLIVLVGVMQVVRPVEVPLARQRESYGWIIVDKIEVTATGNEGEATGNTNSDGEIVGQIHALHMDYAPGVAESTVVTVAVLAPPLTIYQEDDVSVDEWLYPAVNMTDWEGDTFDAFTHIRISGYVNVAVADTSPGAVVTATLWWGPP